MKVNWMQDLDIISQGGGAQNTDRAHFYEGIRREHDLVLVTPQGDINALIVDDSPVIVSNAALFEVGIFHHLMERKKTMIWFFHDYWPIARYRLYYPMLDKCRDCYRRETWLPIIMKAKFLIWLSPLHRESWLWMCPELETLPYALVPSPVDSRQFYDLKKPREGIVAINSLVEFKGRDNVLRWVKEHPEEKIDFIGGSDIPIEDLPLNCRYLGERSWWALNEILNQYKSFLHLPTTPMPFDRTVVEAYLAGCEIIGNKLIGALSYDWFNNRYAVETHCKTSPGLFWNKVEEVFQDVQPL